MLSMQAVHYYCYFYCFTAQVPVSWKRLPWIQMRVQMQPYLVSRYGFHILSFSVRYLPNNLCVHALVLGSPCSSQQVYCCMTPCDLVIMYISLRCGHLRQRCGRWCWRRRLLAKTSIHHFCTENTVAINKCTVTRNVMKVLVIKNWIFYFNMHSYVHIRRICGARTCSADISVRVATCAFPSRGLELWT
jgi:hypothetical protein